MNCTDFRAAIDSAVAGRRPLRPEDAAHLVNCRHDACQQAWSDAVLLDRAIASWLASRPTVDVVQNVLNGCPSMDCDPVRPVASGNISVRAEARDSRPGTARVATAVAVLALLALVLLPSGSDRPLAVRPPPVAGPRDPARDASLTYVTYAQNAAQIVTDAVVLTLGGSEQMEESTVTPPRIGWEADWPPLGDVHAALDDLLESLPDDPPKS